MTIAPMGAGRRRNALAVALIVVVGVVFWMMGGIVGDHVSTIDLRQQIWRQLRRPSSRLGYLNGHEEYRPEKAQKNVAGEDDSDVDVEVPHAASPSASVSSSPSSRKGSSSSKKGSSSSKKELLSPSPSSHKGSSSPPSSTEPKWLIVIHTSPDMNLQRNLIRETWMRLYPANSLYEYKFLLGSWAKHWDPLVQAENSTFGDMWEMPGFQEMEDPNLANHVKNWEFMKVLVQWQKEGKVPKYEYVSKVDNDIFVNVFGYYNEIMAPRLEGKVNNTRTMIALNCAPWGGMPFEYACGKFYTMSWDLVELYVELYSRNPIVDGHEDVLTGQLLRDNNEPYFPVWLERYQMDDLLDESMANGEEGVINSGTLSVHRLKDPLKFLTVSRFFNETGYNGKQDPIYTMKDPYFRDKQQSADGTSKNAGGQKGTARSNEVDLPPHELQYVVEFR